MILLPIILYSSFSLISFSRCPLHFSRDFTQLLSFFSDNAPVTISSVAKFVTGSPWSGQTDHCQILPHNQNHQCLPKNRPGVCKCLTTVSACEIILNLPVHIKREERMMSVFKNALIYETGFGLVQLFKSYVRYISFYFAI